MRSILITAAIVLAALGTLGLRVVLEARAALAAGDDAMARDDAHAAIRAYESAARWYLPNAPHVDTAYDRLRALTKSQQPGVAIAAWRSIRGAALATRGLWTPHVEDLATANEAIAQLSARDPDAGPSGDSTAAREAWHRSRLLRDSRPSTLAVVLAIAGILMWLAGMFGLARRGITASGGLARAPALMSLAVVVLGLGCWALGLYNA